MKHSILLVLLAGCPDHTNGAVLWLAPDLNETHVKLVEDQPNTF